MGVHQYYLFIQWIPLYGNAVMYVCKLKFVKRDFVAKFAPREEQKASWFHHSLIRENFYYVISEAEFFILT